jgi:glycosyltransferase involved in cell wall biosynthesis
MHKPLVSFIVPYYNAGNTIDETIESITNQSFKDFDIWIINDGSTDNPSIEKLNSLKLNSLIHIIDQPNSGPSIARNKAIKLSEAKYVVPLDADDKITPDAIQKSVAIIENNEQIGVVYGNLRFFGERNVVKTQEIFTPEKQFLWNQIAVTALIRKDVFETIGYYDEFLSKPGLEDWEFWIRFGKSNWLAQKTEIDWCEIRVDYGSRTFSVANKNIDTIKEYVYSKHGAYLAQFYEQLYYEKKQAFETPDYKIGNIILYPYRLLKKIFEK